MKFWLKRGLPIGACIVILGALLAVGIVNYINGSPMVVTSVLNDGDTQNKENAVTHTKDILKLIDEGKFTDDKLESMYFSEEEFKKVIKKVDESERLVKNTITYEYYAEEWMCLGMDEETGEEEWGWQKGYKKKSIILTNEHIEKPHKVDWQTVYVLSLMSSLFQEPDWKTADVVQERINDKILDNSIRVFNYEYNYIWDGARSKKTYFTWDELESICYRYSETGNWDAEEYPPGEYHIRTCEKTPTSCVSTILNALEMFEYEFQKNTQCTPRYQKPDNWEVDYMIYNRDADIFTRACQIVAPNFRWNWFLSLLEQMPGVEDTIDEETGEVIPGIYSKYEKYYEEFQKHQSFTKEDHEIEDKGIIVGEELTYLVDNRVNILKKD